MLFRGGTELNTAMLLIFITFQFKGTMNSHLKGNTIIPRYTSNRFTIFGLYEMHKLISVFQFTSQFSLFELLPLANRSLFASGSNGKLIFVLRAVFEDRNKLINRGITVLAMLSVLSVQ
jgi:hypothetical protein